MVKSTNAYLMNKKKEMESSEKTINYRIKMNNLRITDIKNENYKYNVELNQIKIHLKNINKQLSE